MHQAGPRPAGSRSPHRARPPAGRRPPGLSRIVREGRARLSPEKTGENGPSPRGLGVTPRKARNERSGHEVPSERSPFADRQFGRRIRLLLAPRTFPTPAIFGEVPEVLPRETPGFASSADRLRASLSGKSPDGT